MEPRHVVAFGSLKLPFALKTQNARTRTAMREARRIGKARFAGGKAPIDDLEEGAKR